MSTTDNIGEVICPVLSLPLAVPLSSSLRLCSVLLPVCRCFVQIYLCMCVLKHIRSRVSLSIFMVFLYFTDSGPLDTDMLSTAKSTTADPSIRKSISDMSTQGKVLTCEESCSKLMKLLMEDTYPSGAHIDFYDI